MWMLVKPVAPREVRDHSTMILVPAAGLLVEADAYWLRRIRDGDVTYTEATAPVPTPPAAADPEQQGETTPPPAGMLTRGV